VPDHLSPAHPGDRGGGSEMRLLQDPPLEDKESEVKDESERNELRRTGEVSEVAVQFGQELAPGLFRAVRVPPPPRREAFAKVFVEAGPEVVSRAARQGIHQEVLQRGEGESGEFRPDRTRRSQRRGGSQRQGIPAERRTLPRSSRSPRGDVREGAHCKRDFKGEVLQGSGNEQNEKAR